nr:hypothetical protein [Mycoplasmopsis bovis]
MYSSSHNVTWVSSYYNNAFETSKASKSLAKLCINLAFAPAKAIRSENVLSAGIDAVITTTSASLESS